MVTTRVESFVRNEYENLLLFSYLSYYFRVDVPTAVLTHSIFYVFTYLRTIAYVKWNSIRRPIGTIGIRQYLKNLFCKVLHYVGTYVLMYVYTVHCLYE